MAYELKLGERSASAEVEALGDGLYRVTLDGEVHEVSCKSHEPGHLHLLFGRRSMEVHHRPLEEGVELMIYGRAHRVGVVDPRRQALAALAGGGPGAGGQKLSSPMPGRVVRLLVAEGDTVTRGQGLIVVEAMKMENELRAEVDGVVSGIRVSEGDAVEGGAALMAVTPAEEP